MSVARPPASRAVFLSYASQDAAAAHRLCTTLRAAGIETWFDQDELRGGDAWDEKIKRQIRDCALFLPLISAGTNARLEGYFRREWKLAVDRTHDMADEKAFLLPVVIDATTDADARVPERFRAVQWTRLPDGETPPEFCARVKHLLAGDFSDGAPRPDAVKPAMAPRPGKGSGTPAGRRARAIFPIAMAMALVLAGFFWWESRPAAPPAIPGPRAPVTGVDERSIAVLPFTNMSEDKDNAFFADGVHEDLLTQLANLSALKVVSRTSVLAYRNPTKSLRQIAAELGVAYVLEGSVRRAGNQIRVTGQLIKAATDEHIWARSYDRDLKDIFAVQSEVAREIAQALNAALSPADAASLTVRPTANVEASDCFQRARVLERSGVNAHDVREKIIPLLERAVALDPNYATAWAELGLQRLEVYMVQGTPAELADAKAALARAEQIAPEAYEVLFAGSQFGAALGDRELVNVRRRRIVELFPNRAETQLELARTALYDRRWADAEASFRAALRLDPRNPGVLVEYFSFLDSIRRWDEAEAVGEKLIEVQPDNLSQCLVVASLEFRHLGSTAKLTRLLTELPKGPDAETMRIQARGRIAYLTGDWQGLVSVWRESGSRYRSGGFSDLSKRWQVAGAFLKLGDPASARPLLEQNRDDLLRRSQAEPEDISAWNSLGLTLGMLGDREGARPALDRASSLIAAHRGRPGEQFSVHLDNALARSWLGEKSTVIKEVDRLLREPTQQPPTANVHVLRIAWASIPLQGDPEFEAVLNDPRNNAPLL